MERKRILFLSHDASRTGAPILLLNLAKVISPYYDINFLLKAGGSLVDDFKSIAPTYFINIRYSFFQKLINKLFNRKNNIIPIDLNNYDIIIFNTITLGDIAEDIKQNFNGKIISYIHELYMASNYFTSQTNVVKQINCSDVIFVPSMAVKNFLLSNYGVKQKIILLDYFIPGIQVQKHSNMKFVVGGLGTADWRKSPDLFVQVAKYVFKIQPNAQIIFKWQGGGDMISTEMQRIQYDINKLGLADKVYFVKASSDVRSFYSEINILLLTSREDPYPLVVLEAAGSGAPTICFADAGGAPEFIAKANAGFIIDYLDVVGMAEKILFYYNNKNDLINHGHAALNELLRTHSNSDYIINQFSRAILEN